MASVNKVIVVGNLGKDPEVRYTGSGKAVCNLSLATKEAWGKGEDRQEKTEWHKITVWGASAENCGKYLTKGRQVYVEGRLQTRQWEDKDGNTRYTTEIVANNVVFLGANSGGGGGGSSRGGGGGGYSSTPKSTGYSDGDIPF